MLQTFACRLTAAVPSAIATIEVRGPHAYSIVRSLLDGVEANQHPQASTDWLVGRVWLRRWPISQDHHEQVVVCRVEETVVEIHCHGGAAVTEEILLSLQRCGCTPITPSQWCNDRITQADSLQKAVERRGDVALMKATSASTAIMLLEQISGLLANHLTLICDSLRHRHWQQAKQAVQQLIAWDEFARHLTEPWRIVLAGPPNVGKSSLINALTGKQISIVHSEPGTTRDWIEAEAIIGGWPVTLTDTAGIRDTDEQIESQGVRLSKQRIEAADLVVVVVDATVGWTNQHDQIVSWITSAKRVLVAWNKSDLAEKNVSIKDGLDKTTEAQAVQFPSLWPEVHCSAVGPESLPNVLPSQSKVTLDSLAHTGASSSKSIKPLLDAISKILVPVQPGDRQALNFDADWRKIMQKVALLLESEVAPGSQSELELLENTLLSVQPSRS